MANFQPGGRTSITLSSTAIQGYAAHDAVVSGNPLLIALEAKDFDGTALPNSVAEGDVVRSAGSLYGVSYTMLMSEDGSRSAIAIDGEAQLESPAVVNIGGEYRSSAVSYADGNATILQTDVNGRLKVVNESRSEYLDDSPFSINTDYISVIGAYADETAADSVGEGDVGGLRMTLTRKLHIASTQKHNDAASEYCNVIGFEYKLFDGSALPTAAGTEGDATIGASSANGIQYVMPVNADGSLTAIYGEDVAHAAGDGGFHILSVRDDSPVAKAGTDGDYQSFTTDSVGALWVRNRGFDTATDSVKGYEVNPIDSHYVNESLVDTTNVSAATHYYPSSTGGTMDGYQDQSLTGKFIDANGTLTLTLEVTNDEDTSGDWNQVYFWDDEFNAAFTSKTVTNGTELFTLSLNNNNFRRYRWVVVASGATNTVILKERKKAL